MLINKICQEHSKHKIKVDEISRSQPYLKLHVRFTTVPTSAAENSLLVSKTWPGANHTTQFLENKTGCTQSFQVNYQKKVQMHGTGVNGTYNYPNGVSL